MDAANNTIVPISISELTQATVFSPKEKMSTPDVTLSFGIVILEIYKHSSEEVIEDVIKHCNETVNSSVGK